MFEKPYDPVMLEKKRAGMNFSTFIRADYSNVCANATRRNESQCTYHQNGEIETAPNLIHLRSRKYKQWLSDNPSPDTFSGSKQSIYQSRIHIRLESVATSVDNATTRANQIKYIRDPLNECCIMIAGDSFREETSHVHQHKKHKMASAQNERKILLRKYSIDDLQFVLSQLDMELEQRIGYDYTYIYELLNRTNDTKR